MVKIVTAFENRSNETFWKVYSAYLSNVGEEMSFEEMVTGLDVLDFANGSSLFELFISKYFIDQQF